jgi:predicted Zn-dependent protease with MMP-like domain
MSRQAGGRQDRLEADLERGFTALESGDVDSAATCLERCQRIDRQRPEVIALAAALADARGEAEEALGHYRALIALTPDDPMPRICAARLELRDLGDPDTALETVEAAFDFIDEERDLIEAVIVRAEALVLTDDLDAARAALGELSTSVIDDGELALDLADLALAAEDPSLAARWIEIARKDESLKADAMHLLGRIHEARLDASGGANGEDARTSREAMIAAWQEVRVLDAAAPPGPVSISDDEVERIALATLDELPPDVRAKLGNVPILIDDLPSEALVADGLDPRLLGLFSGTPAHDDLAPTITNIMLFKRNLERVSVDLDQLADEIRITVLHETAHYFGLDEDDLERLGLD